MDRWKRSLWGYWDKEHEPGSQGGEGILEEGEETPAQPDPGEPSSRSTPTGTESPFNHPSLKGKSEKEIADLLAIQQSTIKEQGQELNRFARATPKAPGDSRDHRPTDRPSSPISKPDDEPEEPIDFWADPVKAQQQISRKILREELEGIISPFKEDLAARRKDEAWSQLRQKVGDEKLNRARPVMEVVLDRQGIENPDAGTLDTIYYMALGYLADQGAEAMPSGDGGNNQGHRNPPPQHKPSSQPMSSSKDSGKEKLRDLTESERKVARMQGLTDKEYLEYLDMDETEVIGARDDG